MPSNGDQEITFFGRTNARQPYWEFGIRRPDRLSHMYVIGKTGTGKSTLLETMLRQDIARGEGCALIDPHGDLVDRVYQFTHGIGRQDIVYLDFADPALRYGYNPIAHVSPERRALVASGILEVMKKMWADAWGVRMEHVLRNALLALLDQPSATLPDILLLLTDKAYRAEAIQHIQHEPVRAFWTKEYGNYSWRYRADAIAPIQNKVGAFLADPRAHGFLTRSENPLRFRTIMDEGRVLLVNLAKGSIGEDTASLLGGLIVTSIGLAAFTRTDKPAAARRPFWLYVDEFQNFTTLSFATMLSELRKFGVGLVLAHQYLDQLKPNIREAVIGNAGTLISFRLGANDARDIAREFSPIFKPDDLLRLENHELYLRLMIDGMPSHPFSGRSLHPDELGKALTLPF